ncbi:MAG: hypothetical protein ACR2N6_01810 [Miltoncostaeaceae bacterium]
MAARLLTGPAALAAGGAGAIALALAPVAGGAPLFGGEPAVESARAHVGGDGSVTVDVTARHPGVSPSSRGRIHRDATVHEGLVQLGIATSDGTTIARSGARQGLLLGASGRGSRELHRVTLGPAASAAVRRSGGGLTATVTAQSRLLVDGRARPVETVSRSGSVRLPIATGAAPELRAPRCENVRSVASAGRATRIALRCSGGDPSVGLVAAPGAASAAVVRQGSGRTVVDYTPRAGFTGRAALRFRATNADASTAGTRSVTVRSYRLRALGDSVTGGFGFLGDGAEWDFDDLIDCIPPSDFNDRCTSNSPNGVDSDSPVGWLPDFGLSNNVAWPAQFANANDISGPAFANYGVSGSRPQDWDSGGMFNDTLATIVASQPDLTVMTLGANPLLDIFLTGRGIECEATLSDAAFRRCIRGFIQEQKLVPRVRSVLAQLLVAPNNRVVVSQYHSAIPSSSIFSVADLRILFQELNGAVRNAARGAPGFGTRIFLMSPPLFPAGLPPGEAICTSRDTGTLVDGQSRQSRVTQDELTVLDPLSFCGSEEYWIISQDTGIHPSRAGHAQFAASLQRVVDQNNLMPGTNTAG